MKSTASNEKKLFILLSLISFGVLVLRAINVPLFHDEVRTLNHFIKSGILSPFSEYRAANNHLVNSFLARFSYLFFGDSPIAIRLPNVLSYLVYLVFVYRIGSWFRTKTAKWTFFILLLFSFHFISFFGLSRGYGLGFASLLVGMFYLGKFAQHVSHKSLSLTLLCFGIALYSFFSLLLPILVMLGIVGYSLINQYKKIGKADWIGYVSLISAFIAILGYAIHILFYYKGYGILWFGFLEGFWKNTVVSLLQLIFEPGQFLGVLEVLTFLIFGFVCYVFIQHFEAKKWINRSNLFFVFLIFNILGVLLLAWLFDVNYPYQRTGLHLYFFFVAAFSFAIDFVKESKVKYFVLAPFFLVPIHFVASYNLDYVSLWQEDTLPYSFFETIKNEEKSKPKGYKSSLYIEGTAISVWSYGVYKWNQELPICSSNIDTNSRYYDYIIDKKINMTSLNGLYDSIDSQPNSDVILYKRKRPVKKSIYKTIEFNETIAKNKDQLFANFVVDSLPSSSLWFDFETTIRFIDYPMHVYLVFSMENPETQEKYSYKFIEFDRLIHWDKQNHKIYTELANDLPLDKPVEVKVYLWNRYERAYELNKSELSIYAVDTNS